MQSCNRWVNDCFADSFTCGFMAAHSSIIAAAYFPVLLERPGTQCPLEFLIKIVRGQENEGAKFLVHYDQSNTACDNCITYWTVFMFIHIRIAFLTGTYISLKEAELFALATLFVLLFASCTMSLFM